MLILDRDVVIAQIHFPTKASCYLPKFSNQHFLGQAENYYGMVLVLLLSLHAHRYKDELRKIQAFLHLEKSSVHGA